MSAEVIGSLIVGAVLLFLFVGAFRAGRGRRAPPPPPPAGPAAPAPAPREFAAPRVVLGDGPEAANDCPRHRRREVRLPDGPVADIEADDPGGVEAFLDAWPRMRDAIGAAALELQSNNSDGDVPAGATTTTALAAMEDVSVDCVAHDTYVMSARFEWQLPDDAHVVSFWFEAGQVTVSIDG